MTLFLSPSLAAIHDGALRLVVLPDVQAGDPQPVRDPQRQDLPAQAGRRDSTLL